jgi:hypothetical protein
MRRSIWLVPILSCGFPWSVACGPTPKAQSSSQPPAPVLSNCVLHAGDAATTDQTAVTPGEGQDTTHGDSACSYDAECVAERGVETPGDGFVALRCGTGGDCSCRIEPSAPASAAVTFSFRSSCTTLDEGRRLMLDHCMKGMGLAHAEP